MCYQSTTGLHGDILELVERIYDVLQARGVSLLSSSLGLYKQVTLTLMVLRQNVSQMVVCDMFGIFQPTAPRIYQRIAGLLEVVLVFTGISLEETVAQRHLVPVDGNVHPNGQ